MPARHNLIYLHMSHRYFSPFQMYIGSYGRNVLSLSTKLHY